MDTTPQGGNSPIRYTGLIRNTLFEYTSNLDRLEWYMVEQTLITSKDLIRARRESESDAGDASPADLEEADREANRILDLTS